MYQSYVIMNVTNRNQSLVKSKISHYFIRLTICNINLSCHKCSIIFFKFLCFHIGVVPTIAPPPTVGKCKWKFCPVGQKFQKFKRTKGNGESIFQGKRATFFFFGVLEKSGRQETFLWWGGGLGLGVANTGNPPPPFVSQGAASEVLCTLVDVWNKMFPEN